jgi:hypothetical protein
MWTFLPVFDCEPGDPRGRDDAIIPLEVLCNQACSRSRGTGSLAGSSASKSAPPVHSVPEDLPNLREGIMPGLDAESDVTDICCAIWRTCESLMLDSRGGSLDIQVRHDMSGLGLVRIAAIAGDRRLGAWRSTVIRLANYTLIGMAYSLTPPENKCR